MRPLTTRGVILPELLLALALAALVLAVMAPVLRLAARFTDRARAGLAAERDATATAGLLLHDLLAAESLDVAAPAAMILEYLRPVGEAPVCAMSGGGLLLRSAAWRGSRAPAASRDEMLVLVDLVPARWERRVVLGAAAGNCPDGAAATMLSPDLPVAGAAFVRAVEPVRLRQYPSGGSQWLGLEHRWNGTVIQPLAGPLGAGGLQWSIGGGALDLRLAGSGGIGAAFRLRLE